MNISVDYDLVIVGGGVVGAALACRLADTTLRVAMIDAHAFNDQTQPHDDDRTLALSYSTRLLLEKLGVWSALSASAEPIHTVHVSEKGRFGTCQLGRQDVGTPALGYVVEAWRLDRIMLERLKTQENVDLLSATRVTAISQTNNDVDLAVSTTDDRLSAIRCRLLVAADGSHSSIRKMTGVHAKHTDYKQTAIITVAQTERPHKNKAYERFTPQGPLAILPLHDGRCSIVMTVDAADKAIVSSTDTEFIKTLHAQFGYRQGRFLSIGKRTAFPLYLVQSETQFTGRTVFIGNARRSLHPVGGQGFNLALRDVDTLATCLLKDAPHLLGDSTQLTQFTQMRQTDQNRTTDLTDGLARLFREGAEWLGPVRAFGLISLDFSPWARRIFSQQMMGMHHFSRDKNGTKRLP